MVDKIVDTVKSITTEAANFTSNVVSDTAKFTSNVVSDTAKFTADAVTGTAKLTADAVLGGAKLTADAVAGTAKLTAGAVTGTAKFTAGAVVGGAKLTADAVAGTAKFTADAVAGTAKFTANAVTETAKFTSGVVGSTMQILNPTDWVIGFARQYLVSYFIEEEPVGPISNTFQRIENNSIFATTYFAIYPMERVRLLIQNQHMYKENSLKYSGAFDCFFRELREKGVRMLWRGFSPMLPYQLFYFNLLDYRIKTIFDYGKNTGTTAEDTSSFLNFCKKFLYVYFYDMALFTGSHPMEVLFTKIGCNPYRAKDLTYSLYSSYAYCNPIKLYQGYFPGFIMINLHYMLMTPYIYYFALEAYDQLQRFLYIVAGLFAVEFLTYPLDLIKRRMIVQNCEDYAEFRYKSLVNSIAKIYREEHLSGFYKGAFLKFINFGARRLTFLTCLSYYNEYTKNIKKI